MRTNPARPQAGFAIVGVLLVIGAIAVISTTYVRHVLEESQTSRLARPTLGAREAWHSGIQFGHQAVLTGETAAVHAVNSGDELASVEVQNLDVGRSKIFVKAAGSGDIGATALVESAHVPVAVTTHPDTLPRIRSDVVDTLLQDESIPKFYYGGQKRLVDTEIEGVLVVENTSALWLEDVVIRGVIVSEDALKPDLFGDFDMSTVPCAVVDGDLRLEAADFLPGVACVMPDGVFMTWTSDCRVQIEGDVVAHGVKLTSPGACRGNIASVDALELHASFERPGFGRTPPDWADSLDMGGAWDTAFLAFLPRFSTVSELTAIRDFCIEDYLAAGTEETVLEGP